MNSNNYKLLIHNKFINFHNDSRKVYIDIFFIN